MTDGTKKGVGVSPKNPIWVWLRAKKGRLGELIELFQGVHDGAPVLAKKGGALSFHFARPHLVRGLQKLGMEQIDDGSKILATVFSYLATPEQGVFERVGSGGYPRYKLGPKGQKLLTEVRSRGSEPMPPPVPSTSPTAAPSPGDPFAEEEAALVAKLEAVRAKRRRFIVVEDLVVKAMKKAGIEGTEQVEFLKALVKKLGGSSE
ncbi:MAG: hypothetical protein WA057_05110 [Candidatus Magasanikiibacteriota bacterium]